MHTHPFNHLNLHSNIVHTKNCLLLVCRMRTFRQFVSPLMTTPRCPCWFILKKASHLSLCKHHITAPVYATSTRDITASRLRWFQYSVMQSHWLVPLCHHDDVHVHAPLRVQWHGYRYLQRQDYVAPHSCTYTCTERTDLSFHHQGNKPAPQPTSKGYAPVHIKV